MAQNSPMDPQRYYDALTELYCRIFGHDWHLGYWLNANSLSEAAHRMNELLMSRLPATARSVVLDLGCGMGGATCLIAQSKGCRVVGVSNSRSGLRKAEQFAVQRNVADLVSFRFAEALELPFPESTFDGVWSCEAIHNVEDKARLAREIARVLKPGGVAVLGDLFLLRRSRGDEPLLDRLKAFSFHLQTADEWIGLLQTADGVRVDESVSVGHHVFPSLEVCTNVCRDQAQHAPIGLERTILERSAEATAALGEAFASGAVSWGFWVGTKVPRRIA